MKRIILACLFASLLCSKSIIAQDTDGHQALRDAAQAAQRRLPATCPAEGFEAAGVKAMFFEGVPFRGKSTRCFAWYGVPADLRPGERVPAMVLVHGGGGTAFDVWVRLWTKRGYAAIAMDTCGQVPRGKYSHWERHEHQGPPGWGGFGAIDEPPQDQWTYHAVLSVIAAHTLLRSFPEVDSGRVGITGISWGGYLTCIVAGLDDRFKFAAPVYGCGFLGDNSTWLPVLNKMTDEQRSHWLAWWDPSSYLGGVRMPMLWVDGTNDFAYPLDSLQKSYRLAKGPRTLVTRVRMPHGHGGAGENPEEIRAFADALLRGGTPMAEIVDQKVDGNAITVTYRSPVPMVKAELNFTKDTGPWKPRKWETIPAELDADTHRVSATVPEGATVHYLNLIDERGLVVSTEHVEIKP